ncbi:MAG: DUF58 domain-containing protein [Chloroflexota bacterium]
MNALVLGALVAALFFLSVGSGLEILFRLAYTSLGVFVLALVWSRLALRGVNLERHVSSLRSQVGDELVERFVLRNDSVIPKVWLALQDYSSLPQHRVGRAVSLGSRATMEWTVRTRCSARGRFQLGPAVLRAGDPFGLFERRRQVGQGRSIVVYPATAELPSFSVPGGALLGGSNRRERTDQITPNAASLREYVAGDALNRIHWLSTARLGKLMVKEFEPDPIADVWIALDMHGAVHAGVAPESTEEYAVHAAASIGRRFLTAGWAVGLLSVSEHHHDLPPERGDRQLLKLLEELAVIRAAGATPLGELLVSEGVRFGRRATLIAVTSAPTGEWVSALRALVERGVRSVVVLVDAESFGGSSTAGPTQMALAMAGVPAYVVHRGEALADAVVAGTRTATGVA